MNPTRKEQSLLFRRELKQLLPKVHELNVKRGWNKLTDLSDSDQVLSLVDFWMESVEYDLDIDQMDIIIQEEVDLFIKQKPNFYDQ